MGRLVGHRFHRSGTPPRATRQPPVTRDLDTQVAPQTSAVRAFPESLGGYLSQQSDVVAHLVFDHQIRVINLLTRSAWQVRLAEAEKRDVTPVAERAARELADALLFVDEARLPEGLSGSAEFQTAFTARGPVDSKGRSLREFDLRSRLMRYPCSFLIYSDAFDALPPQARDAVWTTTLGGVIGRRQGRSIRPADQSGSSGDRGDPEGDEKRAA